ncbi:MAG: helix-turn-helix transcriptional regulator [Gammaproteobacteria bacterium]
MSQMKINHELGDVVIKTTNRVNTARLKNLVHEALDRYQDQEHVPVSAVHDSVRARYGDDYRSPGYFLRLYRQRAELTQARLAEMIDVRQHHLSEMEHNKRSITKATARRLAKVLDCDYRRFL